MSSSFRRRPRAVPPTSLPGLRKTSSNEGSTTTSRSAALNLRLSGTKPWTGGLTLTSTGLREIDAILGGGRYDGLVEVLGGKSTPGIGFAAGMERFLIAMDDEKVTNSSIDIYFVCLDEYGLSKTLQLSNQLRSSGLKVISDPLRRSMKSQLRDANRSGARFALILGETEMNDGTVVFKDLEKSIQKTILQSEVLNFFDNLTN